MQSLPSSSRPSNNFNLLRLVLASSVILAHSPELIDGDRHRELAARLLGSEITLGLLAVDGFFFLSGFLITQSWENQPSLRKYLGKRVRRIYPGFVVAYLISTLVVPCFGSNPHYWSDFRLGPFFGGLLTLRECKVLIPFEGLPYPNGNGALWTISYEFKCYLLLALIGIAGVLRHRRILVGIGCIFTALALVDDRFWIPGAGQAMGRLGAIFLAGSTFYLFRERVRYTWWGVLIAACLVPPALLNPILTVLVFPWAGGYLLLAAAFARPVPGTGIVRRTDVSYGTYLYAWPIQSLLILHGGCTNPWLLALLTLPIALLAGWLSWEYVEKPMMTFNKPKSTSPQASRTVLAAAPR